MQEQSFKLAKIKGTSVIYPHPVVKGEKYLIRTDHRLTDTGLQVLISALNGQFLSTDKKQSHFYQKQGLHTDGQTPIYEMHIEQLHFNFLYNKSIDLKKGKTIEKVLSQKLISMILSKTQNESIAAFREFEKRLEAQKKCSTCQEMGIQSPKLQAWVQSLSKLVNQ